MSTADTPEADTPTTPVERVNVSHALGPRSAARYATVQALYQIEATDEVLLEPVLRGFERQYCSKTARS